MFKKIFSKNFAYFLAAIGTIGTLSGALAYKYSSSFKPSFYNYKQYISDENKEIIEQEFDYKEFDTLNQFTNAILTNKAVAGIGSDSQVVNLIKNNKLQKIDFKKIFPEIFENQSNKELKDILKELYTDVVWEHLVSYDQDLLTDINGNEFEDGPRHLWEYFVPYFAQDMVVAYNPTKLFAKLNKFGNDYNYKDFDFRKYYELDQEIHNKLNEERKNDNSWEKGSYSLYSILKVLKEMGFSKLEATDSVRDNMIYGSAYRFDNKENRYVNTFATGKGENFGKIDQIETFVAEFKRHLDSNSIKNQNLSTKDQFVNSLEDFVQSQVRGPKSYKELIDQFENIFKNALNYSLNDININFIGNGLELVDKIIDPNTDIEAGIIYNGDAFDAYLANDNNDAVNDGVIRFIRPRDNLLLVDGLIIVANTDEQTTNKIYELAKNSIFEGIADNKWDETENKMELGSLNNFDYIGYTAAYKKLVDYLKENYFNDIFDEEKPEDKYNISDLEEKQWKQIVDYERNYLSRLFDINSQFTVFNPGTNELKLDKSYNVIHHDIKPVSQKTLTEIERYWNLKIKK
ncbi:hypothetical protein VBM87_02260 [Mycoplasma sp. 744]|uniref:hypothetical protein n=1 Tax=Mycoplasma sp. 744 TaxID=3108531 RepID=UPI002B1D0FAB|nr:hypothetical protein [Mycoplasma sp. 744]MEA4115595.1 hypothetical protein [Mycoplasma sp. 744]